MCWCAVKKLLSHLLTHSTSKKIAKNRSVGTIAQFCSTKCLQLRQVSTIRKKLLNSNISSTCPHNMFNVGQLTAEIASGVWVPLQISRGFTSWLRYCTDVGRRRSTKLCRMFGHLLGRYTIYTFLGALAPWRNFASWKIHFAAKSFVLLSCQRYYTAVTALEQWASAKLCDMAQGMELRNFRRGRHLYLAGRPSRWALAHDLVFLILLIVRLILLPPRIWQR